MAASSPQGAREPAEAPPAPQPLPGLWQRHRGTVLTVSLVVYAIALAVAVADDVLHLGLFPTQLERMARDLIAELDAPDAAQRTRAADRLVRDIDTFVAVPELFRALDSRSASRRALAAECLRRITSTSHGYSPDAPRAERRAAIQRWRQWWKASKYRY